MNRSKLIVDSLLRSIGLFKTARVAALKVVEEVFSKFLGHLGSEECDGFTVGVVNFDHLITK